MSTFGYLGRSAAKSPDKMWDRIPAGGFFFASFVRLFPRLVKIQRIHPL